jgi:acetyl esterase
MTDLDVRPDVRAFLDAIRDTPMARLEDLGAEQARAMIAAVRLQRPAPPIDLAVVRDLDCPGPAGPIPLRLYDALAEREPGPAIVYFHGGGFVLGDLESHHPLCAEMARAVGLPVISVAYRLAPEAPWPAAPDDAEAAARWLASPDGSKALGRDVTGIILAGDSAGGNLAAVTARALADDPAKTPVIAQCLIYPTTGSCETASRRLFGEGYFLTRAAIAWFEEAYAAPADSNRYDLLAGDLGVMPATVLVTAGLDPLRDEGRAYAAALALAGVDVVFQEARGNIHGCFGLGAAIPSSAADVSRALAALKAIIFR